MVATFWQWQKGISQKKFLHFVVFFLPVALLFTAPGPVVHEFPLLGVAPKRFLPAGVGCMGPW